jgi:hypothetical protein
MADQDRARPEDPDRLALECIRGPGAELRLRPAPHRRDFMDATPEGFAYRCLPLAIANTYGWEVLNPSPFAARWNGAKDLAAIEIEPLGLRPPSAISHFGEGILTFHIQGLFRTPPGYDLMVTGPINRPKAHIQALTGIIETDWSPYSFTMNWVFTTSGETVVFATDDPVATIFPLRRGEIERFDPLYRKPEDATVLWREHMAWREERETFNVQLKTPGSDAQKRKWQKDYMTGPDEEIAPPHRTRLRLPDFK